MSENQQMGFEKTVSSETGLTLSKLVSKLEAGSRMPDKIHESGFGQK